MNMLPHPGPGAPAPVIPPVPSLFRRRRGKKTSLRPIVWTLALLLGIGLGFGAYRLGVVNSYFDYWTALILS